MAATLKQIADRVGVHPSTVSRVLTGRNENFSVGEALRARIIDTAKEMNYVANELARGLRLQKSHTIGIVVPDILNPLYAGLVRSIEKENTNERYSFLICNTDEDQEKEINHIAMLRNKRMDGLLIVPVQKKMDHIKALWTDNYPFVLILRRFEKLATNAVVMENAQDAYKAVEHLIKLGHRRIGFVRGRQTSYEIQGREQGYRSALAAYHIAVDPHWIVGNGCSAKDGYSAATELIRQSSMPSALLVSENVIIVGVLEALFEAGLSIPYDVSVVSFADMTFSPFFSTALTTISMPIDQIGKESMQILMKQIATPTRHLARVKTLSGHFIVRKSTHKAFGS
mgnify:FL=1